MKRTRHLGCLVGVFAAAGCGPVDNASNVASSAATGVAASTSGSGGGAAGGAGTAMSGPSGSSGAGLGSGGAATGGAAGQPGGDDASAPDVGGPGDDAAMHSDGGTEGSTVGDPGTAGDGTVMIASPFTAAPEMSDKPGVAKGQIVRFTMANSKTFGDGTRAVAVYVPAAYVSGTEVPFMVAQDGVGAQNGGSFGTDDLRPLMDNMIADGRLPAMAGVFVDPAGQRGVEYDTVSDKYYQFVETELLPEVVNRVKTMVNLTLNLTKDPEGRGTFGGSSGGICAFTMGWFHPESYRRILTISGSFVGLQKTAMVPGGGADYSAHLVPESDAKPLRVFLEAGSNDLGGGAWRAANDAMAKALAAKMYHYRYIQAAGAGHEDDGARRQYLPEAMLWLWRGYPIKKP